MNASPINPWADPAMTPMLQKRKPSLGGKSLVPKMPQPGGWTLNPHQPCGSVFSKNSCNKFLAPHALLEFCHSPIRGGVYVLSWAWKHTSPSLPPLLCIFPGNTLWKAFIIQDSFLDVSPALSVFALRCSLFRVSPRTLPSCY